MKKIGALTRKGALFSTALFQWNQNHNNRQMPWKGEKDPYKIWLSEIILQQTRVEQGLKYYEKFITAYPNVEALAAAPEEKVFKLWEGLGYYSRCRNLIASARVVSEVHKGKFPSTYETILALKGVGNYTAAAIASFGYNLPYAVLDGNVFRVLSRIFGVDTPVDTSTGKTEFTALAQRILPEGKAGVYNQAIMDFGALICKPVPECRSCFFNRHCAAFLQGRQDLLPVKEKKIVVKRRWLNYFALEYKAQVLIRQRITNDIWQQLFEFALVETDKALSTKELLELFQKQYAVGGYQFLSERTSQQKLTHQVIHFTILQIKLEQKIDLPGAVWVKRTGLHDYAFPKTLQLFVMDQYK